MLYNIIVSSYQRDNNRTNGRIGDAVRGRLRRGYAVRGYPSEQCSRNHNSPDTAGNGNFASLIPISYCANHDLPSPTDTHLQFTVLLRRTTVLITIRLTQQGMVISLRLFPFPTVLITIYRLRRILICNSLL